MSIDKSKRLAGSVDALGELRDDQVPADGKTWRITKFVGNALYLGDTSVLLVWDEGGAAEDVISCTHGDSDVDLDVEVVGDGVKELSLILANDTSSSQLMGGSFRAKEM